jgi:hypothetical protein
MQSTSGLGVERFSERLPQADRCVKDRLATTKMVGASQEGSRRRGDGVIRPALARQQPINDAMQGRCAAIPTGVPQIMPQQPPKLPRASQHPQAVRIREQAPRVNDAKSIAVWDVSDIARLGTSWMP